MKLTAQQEGIISSNDRGIMSKKDLFLVRVPCEVGNVIRDEAKRLDVSLNSFLSQLVAKGLHLSPRTGSIEKCEICGKKFIRFSGKGPKQLYCSNVCKQRAYRLRRRHNETNSRTAGHHNK